MPIFEYECEECGRFEHIQLSGEKALKKCPTCQEKGKDSKITKLTSAAGLRFKGSGFYITDYTNKGKSSDSKSESKSEGSSKGSSTSAGAST